MGSLTVWVGALFLRSLSSAGVIWHEVLAVDMTAESKNTVGILAFANFNRIAAVNAVAAFPRLFLLCRLSIIKPTSDAFSSRQLSNRIKRCDSVYDRNYMRGHLLIVTRRDPFTEKIIAMSGSQHKLQIVRYKIIGAD